MQVFEEFFVLTGLVNERPHEVRSLARSISLRASISNFSAGKNLLAQN